MVQIYGRKISDLSQPRRDLYLPGPHRGACLTKRRWNHRRKIILCESLIDALTFWCAGVSQRDVEVDGVNGFTMEEHRTALEEQARMDRLRPRRSGRPGCGAAVKTEYFQLRTKVLFPKGMDANEYALKVTPAPFPSLAVLLNKTGREPEVRRQESEVRMDGDEIVIEQDGRRYRVRGLAKNLSHELLRINLLAGNAKGFHVDTLDLYSARRTGGLYQAGCRRDGRGRGVGPQQDLGAGAAEARRDAEGNRSKRPLIRPESEVLLTEEQRAEAMSLLEDPKLVGAHRGQTSRAAAS